jgi:DNA-directed RNA polymerase subunit RPC12/RpoP
MCKVKISTMKCVRCGTQFIYNHFQRPLPGRQAQCPKCNSLVVDELCYGGTCWVGTVMVEQSLCHGL